MLKRWLINTTKILPFVLCGTAIAQDDAQFRRIELSDGRVIVGQVVGTDSDGITLRSGDKDEVISWVDLADMVEIAEAEYLETQKPKITYWGSASELGSGIQFTDVADGFKAALDAGPETRLVDSNDLFRTLPNRQQNDLLLCETTDRECLSSILVNTGLNSYFFSVFDSHNTNTRVTFFRVGLTEDAPNKNVSLSFPADSLPSESSLYQAAWTLLELPWDTLPKGMEAVEPPPAPIAESESPGAAKSGLTQNLQSPWVPLPGVPAIHYQDRRTLFISSAAVGVLTGAAVYFTGGVGLSVPWDRHQAAYADPLFLGGVGALTYGLTSIASNHLLEKIVYKKRQQNPASTD